MITRGCYLTRGNVRFARRFTIRRPTINYVQSFRNSYAPFRPRRFFGVSSAARFGALKSRVIHARRNRDSTGMSGDTFREIRCSRFLYTAAEASCINSTIVRQQRARSGCAQFLRSFAARYPLAGSKNETHATSSLSPRSVPPPRSLASLAAVPSLSRLRRVASPPSLRPSLSMVVYGRFKLSRKCPGRCFSKSARPALKTSPAAFTRGARPGETDPGREGETVPPGIN